MQTLVGIFISRRAAEEAVSGLQAIGLASDAVVFISPEQTAEKLPSVPTTDAESPGMGEVLSGYVGGVIGGGLGLGAGAAIASFLVPGVGTVVAIGIGAAALLGVGGAAVGAAVGEASEKELDQGVPRDEIMFCRELLKRGRSLVIASVESDDSAAAVRAVFQNHEAENVNAARKEWQAARSDQAA